MVCSCWRERRSETAYSILSGMEVQRLQTAAANFRNAMTPIEVEI